MTRLAAAGFADAAKEDSDLAHAVVEHKSKFFSGKGLDGGVIDYHAAINGGVQLVPDGKALTTLAGGHSYMQDDGLLLDEVEPFEALMARCLAILTKVNSLGAVGRVGLTRVTPPTTGRSRWHGSGRETTWSGAGPQDAQG